MKTIVKTGHILLSALLAVPPGLAGAMHSETATAERECRYTDWGIARGGFDLTLLPTALAPTATGSVTVELGKDSIRVRASVRSLEDPERLGLEYLTFVGWRVDEHGNFHSLGELRRDGSRGRLEAEVPRESAGFLITAEPYHSVPRPSDRVILEAAPRGKAARKLDSAVTACGLLPNGSYRYDRTDEDLAIGLRRDRRTPGEISQALNALEIARRSGAEQHAQQRLAEARATLLRANDLWIRGKGQAARQTALEAVAAAEVARKVASERQVESERLRGEVAEARRVAEERAQALEQVRRETANDVQRIAELERRLEDERQRRTEAEQRWMDGIRRPAAPPVAPLPADPARSAATSPATEIVPDARAAAVGQQPEAMLAELEQMKAEFATQQQALIDELAVRFAPAAEDRSTEFDALKQELEQLKLQAERARLESELAREQGRLEAEKQQLERERARLEAAQAPASKASSPALEAPAERAAPPQPAAAERPTTSVAEPVAVTVSPTEAPAATTASAVSVESTPAVPAPAAPTTTATPRPAATAIDTNVPDPALAEARRELEEQRRRLEADRGSLEREAAAEWARIDEARAAASAPEAAVAAVETPDDDRQVVSEPTESTDAAQPAKQRRWWKPWAKKAATVDEHAAPAQEATPALSPIDEPEVVSEVAPVAEPKPRRWWTPWRKKQAASPVASEPIAESAEVRQESPEDSGWYFRTRRAQDRQREARLVAEREAALLEAEEQRREAEHERELARLEAQHERTMARLDARHERAKAGLDSEEDRLQRQREIAGAAPATSSGTSDRPSDDAIKSELERQRELLVEMQDLMRDRQQFAAPTPSTGGESGSAGGGVAAEELGQLVQRLELAATGLEGLQHPSTAAAAAAASGAGTSSFDMLREQLARVVSLEDTQGGVLVRLDGLSFATGRVELTAPARESLARLAGVLLANPEFALVVEGHTDDTGDTAVNQSLSERRAAEVAIFLQQQGVAPEQIRSTGYGESRPIASNTTVEGRKRNRRVDLVIAQPESAPAT